MSIKDPADPADPLSATGIFLNAFRTEPEPAEEPVKESAAQPASRQAPGPGEFTQMFGALPGSATLQPPRSSMPRPKPAPLPPAEEATQIFVRQAAPVPETPKAASEAPAAPAQRVKGFSSPGASDFASDDGSFSQFFRKIPAPAPPAPAPPAPAPSSVPPARPFGATDFFGSAPAAELAAERGGKPAPADAGSVTTWMRKLSVEDEAVASTRIFEAPVASTAPAEPGEFTRIMSGDAVGVTRESPAPPAAALPKAATASPEPPKPATPKAAAPAQSKLQHMLPVLLILNGFLLLVLIVLVVLVLLRK